MSTSAPSPRVAAAVLPRALLLLPVAWWTLTLATGRWVGENFINIAHYMADARSLNLRLVGGGDHDWNELFYRFGLLGESSVQGVAALTHLLGALLMLVGLVWSLYFLLPPGAQDRFRRALSRR